MEETNFSSYILNKFNLVIGIIGSIITIAAIFKADSLWKTFLIVTIVLFIVTCSSLYKMFKVLKTYKKNINSQKKKYDTVKEKLQTLQDRFDKQSEQYSENIQELQKYKQVTHVVESIVNAPTPKTEEAKRMIEILRYSIEKKINRSE
jgi:hypothetical protein